MEKKRILVGMSGGVDSSVTALLLKEQGHDVKGITMKIWDGEYKKSNFHSCYGPNENEEIEEAHGICAKIGIDLQIFDCAKEYKQLIIEDFKSEYLSGRTPNPCVKCNQLIKFGLLPSLAEKSGLEYDYFATGHYANIGFDVSSGRYLLKKAKDLRKDQTYFLYRLSQKQLSKLILPLGNFIKPEVKKIAEEKLGIVDKKESQNFYSGNYNELLNVGEKTGNIVDTNGNILGTHNGIWNYTIGQRKKIDVNTTKPLYVISLNKENNTVVVGDKEDILRYSFIVTDLNWIAIENLLSGMSMNVKIRSSQNEYKAFAEPFENNKVKVTFEQAVEAITPGQSAVFYDNDIVIGGGIIEGVFNSENEK